MFHAISQVEVGCGHPIWLPQYCVRSFFHSMWCKLNLLSPLSEMSFLFLMYSDIEKRCWLIIYILRIWKKNIATFLKCNLFFNELWLHVNWKLWITKLTGVELRKEEYKFHYHFQFRNRLLFYFYCEGEYKLRYSFEFTNRLVYWYLVYEEVKYKLRNRFLNLSNALGNAIKGNISFVIQMIFYF